MSRCCNVILGWRIRKEYFLVKNKDQPKNKFILSWVSPSYALLIKNIQIEIIRIYLLQTECGPYKFGEEKDRSAIVQLLSTLNVRQPMNGMLCELKNYKAY